MSFLLELNTNPRSIAHAVQLAQAAEAAGYHRYLGGPQPREGLERAMPKVPGRRLSHFVIDQGGAMIGMVTLDRRDAENRELVRPDAGEVEIGYMILPQAWGRGYTAEASSAELGWYARAVRPKQAVLCTQTANERSMRLAAKLGFTEVERHQARGAEQWLGVSSRVELPG